jgi:hypothetical protein
VHYREQGCLVLPWWALYLCSRRFRQAAEVRAYRRQYELGGITIEKAAWRLATQYRLGIDEARARELLA